MTTCKASKEYADAYAKTEFTVFGPDEHVLRIGQGAQEAASWLRRHGAQSATVVTAWNPFSCELSPEQNQERQLRLQQELATTGLHTLTAQGQDKQSEWPAEPSLCVFDGTPDQIDSWLVKFEQNAVVQVDTNGACTLLWHPDLRTEP